MARRPASGGEQEEVIERLLSENDSLYRELEGLHLAVAELRRQANGGWTPVGGGGAASGHHSLASTSPAMKAAGLDRQPSGGSVDDDGLRRPPPVDVPSARSSQPPRSYDSHEGMAATAAPNTTCVPPGESDACTEAELHRLQAYAAEEQQRLSRLRAEVEREEIALDAVRRSPLNFASPEETDFSRPATRPLPSRWP